MQPAGVLTSDLGLRHTFTPVGAHVAQDCNVMHCSPVSPDLIELLWVANKIYTHILEACGQCAGFVSCSIDLEELRCKYIGLLAEQPFYTVKIPARTS